MGHIQRAASAAVDSTLQATSHMASGVGAHSPEPNFVQNSSLPVFGQSHRPDLAGMNTSLPRSNLNQPSDNNPWPKVTGAGRCKSPRTPLELALLRTKAEYSGTPIAGSRRQRVGRHSSLSHRDPPVPAATPVPVLGRAGPNVAGITPSFANNRRGFTGVGLTSGLKVSQPTNSLGLDAAVRP